MPIGAYIADGVLWALVIFQGVVILGLVKKVYEMDVHQTSPMSEGKGEVAPDFTAVDITGESIDSKDYAGAPRVLLFITLTCEACLDALGKIEYLKRKGNGKLLVICKATKDECQKLITEYGIDVPIIADQDQEIIALYYVSSFPTAILIAANDRIESTGSPERWHLNDTIKQDTNGQHELSMGHEHGTSMQGDSENPTLSSN